MFPFMSAFIVCLVGRFRLPLEHGDEIVSVTVYAGDLVDRIVLRSAYGRELSAGGSGGSPIKVARLRGAHSMRSNKYLFSQSLRQSLLNMLPNAFKILITAEG